MHKCPNNFYSNIHHSITFFLLLDLKQIKFPLQFSTSGIYQLLSSSPVTVDHFSALPAITDVVGVYVGIVINTTVASLMFPPSYSRGWEARMNSGEDGHNTLMGQLRSGTSIWHNTLPWIIKHRIIFIFYFLMILFFFMSVYLHLFLNF